MGNSNERAATGSRHRNLVTIEEAAKIIPYSAKTLRNWRCNGKNMKLFVTSDDFGKVLFDFDEWDKIIDSAKEKTARDSKRLGLDD
jgi:hypothetical protein